jgi:hypothetical protein
VAFERRRIERQRLAEPLADLFHHAVRHLKTRLFAKLFHLIGRERELLSFGLGQRPAKSFLLRGDALFLAGPRLRDGRTVGGVELFAQIIEVKAEAVARTVFGQHAAVAVENFPAHGGDADGAIRLRFQMAFIFARGNDLHPPQAGQQNKQAARQRHRQEAELRIVFFQFVKNQHGT